MTLQHKYNFSNIYPISSHEKNILVKIQTSCRVVFNPINHSIEDNLFPLAAEDGRCSF
ncbi:MAG: hypothetical protein WCQ55_06900 [Paludibacteraceae bacterium]